MAPAGTPHVACNSTAMRRPKGATDADRRGADTSPMTHEIHDEDPRGTEPASQADDPTLTDDGRATPTSDPAPATNSGPWIVIGIVLLAVFVVVLIAAITAGAMA